MKLPLNSTLCCSVIFICCLLYFSCTEAMSCDSCGSECTTACGTKHFRTCCFNYLRKRTPQVEYNDSENTYASTENNNKLDNWIKDTRDIESIVRHIYNIGRAGMNSHKRHQSNDELVELS